MLNVNERDPVNPVVTLTKGYNKDGGVEFTDQVISEGETKFEKAFWQVYSSLLAEHATETYVGKYNHIAEQSLKAVKDGFKVLEDL